MDSIVKVFIFSAVAFVVLFALSKLMGKKQIAQLDFVDYVIGISIGSIAADMAAETQNPFYYYIIAMVMFFVLDLLVTHVARKGPFLKRVLKGKPIVIVYDGKLDADGLRKSKLDINDLLMLMRNKNFFDIADVQYAFLETNGSLSILPVGAERPIVARDLADAIEEPTLPNYLVVDGEVSGSGLSEIDRDKSWLFERLGVSNKRELKKILLASYDDENDDIIVHFQS